MMGDREFKAALDAEDIDALAREIRARLDACSYGTHVSFRLDRDLPCCWRGYAQGTGSPSHKAMARDAAVELIASKSNDTDREA